MTIKKQYFKTKPVCRVTFKLEREAATDAEKAVVVGEFNGWSADGVPMKRLKDGSFKATVDLVPGREYQFRYLLDGRKWENDGQADKYVPTQFADVKNSVVKV